MNKTATGILQSDQIRQDDIRLWHDAALGVCGVDMVAGHCRAHRYQPHFHDEFFVGCIEYGAQKYRIGRHSGVAGPGCIMIIPPGEVHSVEAVSQKKGWSFHAFYPDAETLDELSRELFVGRGCEAVAFNVPPAHQDANLARYLSVHHRVIEQETDILARQQAFAAAMTALMSRCARPNRKIRASGHEPQAIRRAVDCANARFNESGLSVTDLAEAAGLSVYHFMRCFRSTMGLTAHQYVLQVRLREARSLLAQELALSHVAYAAGFSDQSHLNRHFRRAFGLTPGQYAKATRFRKGDFPHH